VPSSTANALRIEHLSEASAPGGATCVPMVDPAEASASFCTTRIGKRPRADPSPRHDARISYSPRGVLSPVIVLSAPFVNDESTGTNAGELRRVGLGGAAAVFPRAAIDAPVSCEAANVLLRAILR
jgi:hypothetical protein